MSELKLTFVTPLKKFFENKEVEEIKVPAERGELTILPGHSPLVTTLSTGIFSYKLKGESEFTQAVVSWGYCEVINEEVRILAETAETPDMIDKKRVEDSLKSTEEKLNSNEVTPEEINKYQRKLKRAEKRLELLN